MHVRSSNRKLGRVHIYVMFNAPMWNEWIVDIECITSIFLFNKLIKIFILVRIYQLVCFETYHNAHVSTTDVQMGEFLKQS